MTRHRPRVGMHVLGTGNGGIWRYVHAILARIDLQEFDVLLFSDIADVYAPRPEITLVPLAQEPPHSARKDDAKKPQPPVAAVGRPGRSRDALLGPLKLWTGAARDSWRLARTFRGHQIDLLHTNQTGCEEAPIAARMANVPRVLGTFHIDSSYDLSGRRSGFRHRMLEHVSNHCLSKGIGVSRQTNQDWVNRTHLRPSQVVTIYNGIDPDHFRRQKTIQEVRSQLGLPADVKYVIGGIGRLEEAKGFTYLLAAMPALLREHPKLMLIIAGEGPLRALLEGQATQLGVEQHVRFMGFQRDVQCVLDALDVFVLPSLCETLGYAFLEAMATGLPTVGTTVGGVPEVILHGETGLLVPPRDEAALASSISMLLSSPGLRQRMGDAGRERVTNCFSEAEMVSRTLALYHQMLS